MTTPALYPSIGSSSHNNFHSTHVHLNPSNGFISTSLIPPNLHGEQTTPAYNTNFSGDRNNNNTAGWAGVSGPLLPHSNNYVSSTARYGTYNTTTNSLQQYANYPHPSSADAGYHQTPYHDVHNNANGFQMANGVTVRRQSYTTASLFDMIAKSQRHHMDYSLKAKRSNRSTNGISSLTKSISKSRIGGRNLKDEELSLCVSDYHHANYSNIVSQIREVNRESKGCCEFLTKAYRILHSTVVMTIFLMLVLILPTGMVILGVKYLHDCPKEPFLPIYLLVGGCFGMLKMFTILWRQMRERKSSDSVDSMDGGANQSDFITDRSTQFTDMVLTLFLLVWFGFGNYWTWRIYKPNFSIQLYEPMDWCEQTLYMFCVVQIIACYSGIVLFLLCLSCLGCTRYILQSS